MFLETDGLSQNWKNESPSDYKGEMGLHSLVDVDNIGLDYSGMGQIAIVIKIITQNWL